MRFIFATFLTLLLVITDSNAYFNQFKPSQFSDRGEIVVEIWNSPEGLKRLEQSRYKSDFYQLANFFQPQINPLYCGIASSVIILNAFRSQDNQIPSQKALEATRPEIYGGGSIEFKTYSQLTFLNEVTEKIKKREVIELKNFRDTEAKIDPGLTLKQLADMLVAYNLKVVMNYVTEYDARKVERFRSELKTILNDKDKFVLVNFKGSDIGLETFGHVSPVAAYDRMSDSVLIMDVASHKNSWYWVKIDHLFKAMNTRDGNQYRGYLIVSE